MSLKSIDTQLAVSRAADSSQIQHQLTHKPLEDQAALAAQFRKQLEEERKKSGKLEQKSAVFIRDEEQRRQRRHSAGNRGAATRDDDGGGIGHPYKGRHIDITL